MPIIATIQSPPPERCDLCLSEDRHGALLCATCAEAIRRLHDITIKATTQQLTSADAVRLRAICTKGKPHGGAVAATSPYSGSGAEYVKGHRRSPRAYPTSFNTDEFDNDDI